MNIRWHVKNLLARAGIRLLKLSGCYDGYWSDWRNPLFSQAEGVGLHILPVHYYSPVPDTRQPIWQDRPHDSGVDYRIDAGLETIGGLVEVYRAQMDALPKASTGDQHQFHLGNNAYHPGEAEILYGMVRSGKPKRIMEIGCGFSSLLIAQALRDGRAEFQCDYVCIEPYPPDYLNPPPEGVSEFVSAYLQPVPLERFKALQAGDILFIDSTHVVKTGSDVVYEYLEILPILKPGVIIHIHDIFLPFEYPKEWTEKMRFFWNEQYLLKALLLGSHDFEIMIASHAIYRDRRDDFQALVPSLANSTHGPSAFWMKRI